MRGLKTAENISRSSFIDQTSSISVRPLAIFVGCSILSNLFVQIPDCETGLVAPELEASTV